jgi:fatty acid elongase 3
MSTDTVVWATLAGYLGLIFGIQGLMRNQNALKLQFLFQAHNLLLSLGSLVLLALMLEEIVPTWWNNGILYTICSPNAYTKRLETYYIINYYFKYWELVDTVFLAVKKKPLGMNEHKCKIIVC